MFSFAAARGKYEYFSVFYIIYLVAFLFLTFAKSLTWNKNIKKRKKG